jgi:hypothetical protein
MSRRLVTWASTALASAASRALGDGLQFTIAILMADVIAYPNGGERCSSLPLGIDAWGDASGAGSSPIPWLRAHSAA